MYNNISVSEWFKEHTLELKKRHLSGVVRRFFPLSLSISCPGRAGCLLWFWPVSLSGWQLIDIQKHGLLSRVCSCALTLTGWRRCYSYNDIHRQTIEVKGQIIIQIEGNALRYASRGFKFGIMSHQTILWNWMFCHVAAVMKRVIYCTKMQRDETRDRVV